MATVQEIESAVTHLSEDQLAQFRQWFADYDAHSWDDKFEQDTKNGKLVSLANKAIADFRAGRFKEL